MRVIVVDTGLGNLRSVERALLEASRRLGDVATIEVSRVPSALADADRIVMPGQGAFRDCSLALDGGWREALRASIERGTPYLGICLGLQVLFERSAEADPSCKGLGLFAGSVRRLGGGIDALTGQPLPIPHVGWNTADPTRPHALLPLTPTHFYFVHSYAVVPDERSIVAATSTYGEPFVSAVAKDNVLAVQFHPEKSQQAGLALLERFLRGPHGHSARD